MSYHFDIDLNRRFPPSNLHFGLTHVTFNWETLVTILREGFKIKYCTETLISGDRELKAAFPMICFCSMSRDELFFRTRSYGQFSITLNNDWGHRHRLNPVFYLAKSSDFSNGLMDDFDRINNTSLDEIESALNEISLSARSRLIRMLINYFSYTKNFYGPLMRKGVLVDENYGFGFEREWRYVYKGNDAPYVLTKDQIDQVSDLNGKLDIHRLQFEPCEIENIVVETEYEKAEVLRILAEERKFQLPADNIYINTMRHQYFND